MPHQYRTWHWLVTSYYSSNPVPTNHLLQAAEDGPGLWVLGTHSGAQDEAPGSAPAFVTTWEVNYQEDLSIYHSFFSLSSFFASFALFSLPLPPSPFYLCN